MQIFAMSVDVAASDFVERVGTVAPYGRFARFESGFGRLLRAENDVIYLALPGCEVSVDGKRARDVGSVHGIFAGSIDDHHVAGLHDVRIVRVMKNGRVVTRSHDQR